MSIFRTLRRPIALAFIAVATATWAVPAVSQQALTRSDGVNAGARFDVYFERAAPCITRITDSSSGGSVDINLDCRNRPLGTTVLFDLFKAISLNPVWSVSSFSTSTGSIVSRPSGTNPRISVRLAIEPGRQRTATVTVMVTPMLAAIPQPLPNCQRALNQRPRDFVCQSDADCVPTIVGGPAEICSLPCGNRCMPR
jgi:hypothetical protein